MLELLKADLAQAPIIKKGDYDYFVHPVTDGVPRMKAAVFKEIVDTMMQIADLDVDIILGPEAMGIPYAVAISERTGIPYGVVRKRSYGLPGEVVVEQQTGYSSGKMYINDLHKGERVLLVDDVISTGGTIRGTIQAIRRTGASLRDVVIVLEKGNRKAEVEAETAIRIKTLVKVEVREGRLVVSN